MICNNDYETSTQYLLHYSPYTKERMTLLDRIKCIHCGILELSDAVMTKIILFEDFALLWHRGVVVITTADLHSTKPELTFCTDSNPAGLVLEICDGGDL